MNISSDRSSLRLPFAAAVFIGDVLSFAEPGHGSGRPASTIGDLQSGVGVTAKQLVLSASEGSVVSRPLIGAVLLGLVGLCVAVACRSGPVSPIRHPSAVGNAASRVLIWLKRLRWSPASGVEAEPVRSDFAADLSHEFVELRRTSFNAASYGLYALTVAGATTWIAWRALMMEPASADQAILWTPAGWTPGLVSILIWSFGLLLLTIVPFAPVTGILVYVALFYGIRRFSPELSFMLRSGMRELICGLSIAGTLVWMSRHRRLNVWPPPLPVLLATTFVCWVVASSLIVAPPAGNDLGVLKHGLTGYLSSFGLLLVAACRISQGRQLLWLAVVLATALVVRAHSWADAVHLDEDLALLSVMAIPLCGGAMMVSNRRWQKGAYLLLILELLRILYLTQNRGAAAALAVLVPVGWLISSHRMVVAAVAGPCLLIAGTLFRSTGYWQRFEVLLEHGLRTGSAAERLILWEAAWTMFRSHWCFGIGPGNFGAMIGNYAPHMAGYSSHNTLLTVLVELGLPGLVIYLVTCLAIAVSLWCTRQYAASPQDRIAAASVFVALTAFLVAGMFITRSAQALPWILAGFAVSLSIRRTAGAASCVQATSQPWRECDLPPHVGQPEKPAGHIRPAPQQQHFVLLTVLFAAIAIYGSLVPLEFQSLDLAEAAARFTRIPWLHLTIHHRADWVANILLFIPLGFLGMGAMNVDRPGLPIRRTATLFAIVAWCTLLSISLEFTQLWFPPRTVSQNDIAAETLGGIAGAVLWLWAGQHLTEWCRIYTRNAAPHRRFNWLLDAYLLGLVVYSVMPLDLTISLHELFDKFQMGRIELIPFSHQYSTPLNALYSILTAALVFVPVGIWSCTFLLSRGETSRPVGHSLLIVLMVATGIEAAQLLVYSRFTSVTDVLLGCVGGGIGVALQRLCLNHIPPVRPAARNRQLQQALILAAAAVVYSMFLALLFWAPFDWAHDTSGVEGRLHGFWVVPFSRLYSGTEYHALVHILRRVLWFVPLGVLLSLAVQRCPVGTSMPKLRTILLTAAGVYVCAVAFTVELAQVLLPEKFADVTDVLLSGTGGLFGLIITARWNRQPQQSANATTTVQGAGFVLLQESTPAQAAVASSAAAAVSLPSDRIPGLDGLRALACLGVFGVHFQQMTGVDADGGPFSLSRLMLNGNTGVCLFFLLSGFLLSLPVWLATPETRNQKLLQGYVRRRTMRILPAYLICLAALVLVTRHWQTAGDRLDVLLHGMLLHNYRDSTFYSINAPFWTVAVQVQFYTVFGLLVSLLVRLRTVSDRVLLLVTGSLIPAAWLLHMLLLSEFDGFPSPPNGDGFYGESPVLTRSLIAHLPIFVLGTMTAWCHVKCSRSSKNCISASAADLLFVGSAFVLLLILATPLDDTLQVPGGRYNLPFVPLLLGGMILLVPRSRAVLRCLDVPPLRGIGMISYGIYLFHVPCLKLAAAVLHSGGTSPETAPLLFAVSGGLLSIAVASLSWFLLERHVLARAGSSRVGI